MKAVQYHSYGPSDVLAYEDADRPVAGSGQVVVKVVGSSFNPVDVAIRLGLLQESLPITFPHIPGLDVAGVIADVGDGVTGWSAGNAVVAMLPLAGPGSAAEYVTVSAEALAAAPRTSDLADAASLPTVGVTAWQALYEHANVTTGHRVLVNGAGGAVGGYFVQLASQAGQTVTAVTSPRSAERLRAHGASQVIDHTTAPLPQSVAGQRFDAVLNLVRMSPDELGPLADLVTDGGTLVSTATPGLGDTVGGVRAVQMYVRNDAAQLGKLVARVDAGELRIHVAERRPLADLAAVHDDSLAGRLAGKTVLVP